MSLLAGHRLDGTSLNATSRRDWLRAVCAAAAGSSISQLHAAEPATGPDAQRAFGYLEAICKLGPRISGTEPMALQQQLVGKHFTALGARVSLQEFDTPHPVHGTPVRIRNMIVEWHPETTTRVLLSCHYDTRPRPDEELLPSQRNGVFIGANDGGSGVATLMEIGHAIPTLPMSVGVDFIFFDAEELIYQKPGKFFIGSEYFARQYRDQPPAYRYQAGVLLDMVADLRPQFYFEGNSLRLAPDVTRSVWAAAKAEGVKEFFPKVKHTVIDDHLALNQVARIPTCDVIDFDYPHWHKRNDLPAACSGETMAKVARVMLRWLRNL
ncbi:MAG: peptidase M28 [Planctomycetota bacterium]|nr:MAG: peptidase M28 [Planctomycetota bacterium]